ncbi:hypothetical protein MSG28_004135 [Choristoneura fumiferana]|uniref:Uncharacterized protein n=1 Tax=Choristoneura fumiferana TaxID=7141 RepID=A0ACC0KHP3_CHOFU|nr:hypothetical protein MSG28_004135 [Choristoneura fumiferana]
MESPRQSEYDTVEYWKKQAKHYEQKANDMQQELDEYTENSAQLEKELEASLIQVEKQNRDLEHQNQRLKNEIESLKTKLDRSQHETNALENELQALKIEQDKKAEYIRELEQKNDDLERGQRVISESVSCIESLLNQAYERNAVLESEVDEVENLKQELKVVEKIPVHRKEDESTIENPMVNGHVTNREINGNAMTPSARVSAINIVGDLLRKVGLERFLCRDCGKIKCSCDIQPTVSQSESVSKTGENNSSAHDNDSVIDNTIEYRNPKLLIRQSSGPDLITPKSHSLNKRSSEEPFVRSAHGENGKLRRSFAALESKLASCRGTVRPKEHSPNSSSDVNKDYSLRFGEADKHGVKFFDDAVCKSFLLQCCPHEILSSTRMDLGECPKIHDLALRADFELASKTKDYFYDIDATEHLEAFIADCDRRTTAAKQRLAETQEELSAEVTEKANSVHELAEQIGQKLARAEALGEEGMVEESVKLMGEIDDLRKKKAVAEQEYRNSMPASSYQQQKLRVCEVCSAYLGIHDNDRRLADHFGGKLHLGFITIREKLSDLKKLDIALKSH